MTLPPYNIKSNWNGRAEGPDALAARFIRLIDVLTPLHPAFRSWTWCGRDAPAPFETVRRNLTAAVAANRVHDDFGPAPKEGYDLGVLSDLERGGACALSVWVQGGSILKVDSANGAKLETAWNVPPDPTLVTYPIMKAAMLALIDCFDVETCKAFPSDITDLWQSPQDYSIAWMTYVHPAWAPLIGPPATAIVERLSNGGFLLAAADETFITANPAHLAVARDIAAAVAPLRDLRGPT